MMMMMMMVLYPKAGSWAFTSPEDEVSEVVSLSLPHFTCTIEQFLTFLNYYRKHLYHYNYATESQVHVQLFTDLYPAVSRTNTIIISTRMMLVLLV